MAKKNFAWGFWKYYSNSIALFMAGVTAIVVISSVKRSNWRKMENINMTPQNNYTSCNLFSGRWVFDNSSHPLYSGLNCPYMNDEIACDKYGRKDIRYQGWRWQPHGCNLPRFDARGFLERLRGKRMVYVGDSLNRNQWMSMICLLESSIANEHKQLIINGSLKSFKAKEFNASIDFYWSPLLVESNCDDPVLHRLSNRIMRAGAIEKHAQHWTDANILIFNSYLWWMKPRLKMKILYGSFDDKEQNYQEVEMIDGFEVALKTWANWLEFKVDALKTKLFFMSLSPTHLWGGDWGAADGKNCYNETEPIPEEGYTATGNDYRFLHKVEDAIEGLGGKGVNVQMLNITQLSEYRKDGHPSIYRKHWDPLDEDKLANPSSYSDCTHWCLPGVPDVWNEILYAYIISK
ncbi:protein trichome birefringence-like 34 [Asparagus officinalis]|uniref:protein trichome birefringence-like 34 n=1 Tax=Asparagus officinalis TaxID=4686 RepID=UPI00098E6B14|nr:protein trichome birefringence-like 34 [Asparagus officinalis]